MLQQHCVFFDKDNDGVIWPLDTFYGFHQIGFNIFLCIISMFVIHSGFRCDFSLSIVHRTFSNNYPQTHSYVTCPSWIPDPLFRVYLPNIHKAKHGSDSGTYDSEGRFAPQHFEDIFSKYGSCPIPDFARYKDSQEGQAYLRPKNLAALHKGNRNAMDPFGWGAGVFELFAAWWISDGALKKEELRSVYDGSLFYQRWEEVKAHESKFWKAVGRLVRTDEAFHDRVAQAALADLKAKMGRQA